MRGAIDPWLVFFFFKQKTAYEMRISDWSSDVCSSDLDSGDVDVVLHRERNPPERSRRVGFGAQSRSCIESPIEINGDPYAIITPRGDSPSDLSDHVHGGEGSRPVRVAEGADLNH